MTDTPDTPDPSPNPTPEDKPKRVRGDALKRFRKAAKRTVRDNSGEIAKKLLDQTLKGDMPSAKMLVSLIGKPVRRRPKKEPEPKPVRSLALDLASDPPCPPQDDDWARLDDDRDPDNPPS
jgi:hypothetical protein